MRIKIFSLFLGLSALAFGTDCDGSFVLDSTHTTVQFNNQSRACVNWQISYFASGFSALSVQFESAPNGSNSNVPGTWVAFAGSILGGVNPNTAITQATSTFTGSFPWVRVRLVSSTGTGTINGRMLGAQLTSATGFQSGFASTSANAVFGNFTLPINSTFSWVDQGNATETDLADGFNMNIPVASASLNMAKRCATLPAAPWTVIMAYTAVPNIQTTSTYAFGLLLQQTGGGTDVSEKLSGGFNTTTYEYVNIEQCTTNLQSSCAVRFGNTAGRVYPVSWERVIDNGVTREWEQAVDGKNWSRIVSSANISGGNYANIVPTQACMYLLENNANGLANVKVVSWQICSGSTGVC